MSECDKCWGLGTSPFGNTACNKCKGTGKIMSETVELDIPADAAVRARRSLIQNLLEALIEHDATTMQTVDAIEDLIRAVLYQQATGRTRAGNDIGGI